MESYNTSLVYFTRSQPTGLLHTLPSHDLLSLEVSLSINSIPIPGPSVSNQTMMNRPGLILDSRNWKLPSCQWYIKLSNIRRPSKRGCSTYVLWSSTLVLNLPVSKAKLLRHLFGDLKIQFDIFLIIPAISNQFLDPRLRFLKLMNTLKPDQPQHYIKCCKTMPIEHKFNEYLMASQAEKIFTPLVYWQINTFHWPNLARLAKEMLPVPATSARSESSFSSTLRVCSNRWVSFTPLNIEAQVCLKIRKKVLSK